MHYLSLTQDQFVYTCPERGLRLVTSDPFAILLLGLLLEVEFWVCDNTFTKGLPPGMTWRQRSLPFSSDLYYCGGELRKLIDKLDVGEGLDTEDEEGTVVGVISRLNQMEQEKRSLMFQFKAACDAGDLSWRDTLEHRLRQDHFLNSDEVRYLQTSDVRVEDPFAEVDTSLREFFDDL